MAGSEIILNPGIRPVSFGRMGRIVKRAFLQRVTSCATGSRFRTKLMVSALGATAVEKRIPMQPPNDEL
jgi:hypothetical protein